MATLNLAFTKAAYVKEESPNTHFSFSTSNFYDVCGNEYDYTRKLLYIAFESIPNNLKHNAISFAKMRLRAKAGYGNGNLNIFGTSDFNANTLTFSNAPALTPINILGAFLDEEWSSEQGKYICPDQNVDTFGWTPKNAVYLKTPRFCIQENKPYSYVDTSARIGLIGGGNAYIEVTYSDSVKQTSQVAYKSGPKSGYYNPRNAATFSWDYEAVSDSIYCADPTFEQTSAIFYWKKSTDVSYIAVAISGTTKQTTIAANTFPTASTIQWYVSGTDEDGTTTQTSVFSFSTAAGTATANCVAPVNSVEDGSGPIIFQWSLSSTDGQQPSRIRAAWRQSSDPDESEYYNELFDTTTITNSYTASGGTFPAGEITWVIRVWNIDGTEGNRDYAEFISVAAPDPVEGLEATEDPITTISWQSSAQQAYEISIDGVVVKKAFGPDVYSLTVDEPLEAGTHVISVRVQGVYGFWSQPSEVTITVGGPASTTTLIGEFGIDAVLRSDSTTPSHTIRYYRDGICIGTAPGGQFFTDRRALGTHSYFTRRFIGDGTYEQSNTVTGTMVTVYKQICALDDPDSVWLELRLSENSMDSDEYSLTNQHVLQHVTGTMWPHGEFSKFRDVSASYNCAFIEETEMLAFENLFGKPVILKAKGGEVVIGLLSQIQKHVNIFYTSYSFAIQKTYVPDFVEITS